MARLSAGCRRYLANILCFVYSCYKLWTSVSVKGFFENNHKSSEYKTWLDQWVEQFSFSWMIVVSIPTSSCHISNVCIWECNCPVINERLLYFFFLVSNTKAVCVVQKYIHRSAFVCTKLEKKIQKIKLPYFGNPKKGKILSYVIFRSEWWRSWVWVSFCVVYVLLWFQLLRSNKKV